jgi:hypothetical protein
MNASRFAIGLVSLAIAGLWYFAGGTDPLPVAQAAETPRVTPPLTHENLTVYFVYGTDTMPDSKVMTLNEALERELAVVHETSDVNTLAVENKSSEYELFIQSGDIVKGGKQDRMSATDMLLPPKSGVVPLPAHCVEQGRWTGRGSEDSQKFKSSVKCAVGNEMKFANYGGQQSVVWQTVSDNQGKLNANLKTTVNAAASPTSFQLTLEAPAVKAKVDSYEASLKAAGESRDDIIGVVFVVNGQITSAEVYGSNAIFRKAWPKLLNAAAVEAVAERDKAANDTPSAREIEYFLARAAEPEPAGDVVAQGRAPRRGNNDRETFFLNANDDPGFDANLEAAQPEVQRLDRQTVDVQTVNDNIGRPNAPNPAGAVQVQNRGPIAQQAGGAAIYNQQSARTGRILIQGNEVTGNRVQLNAIGRGGRAAQPAAPQPPANDGNRLNSNFNDNRGSLMVESRDPNRQNAVIHRSYLKK